MGGVQLRDRRFRLGHYPSRPSPIGSDNSNPLLLVPAKAKFGGGEQTVGNQDISVDAVVDEFRLAVLADDEQWRHFTLADPGREFDVDFVPVIIGIQRPPWRMVAFDQVAISALAHVRDQRRWLQ